MSQLTLTLIRGLPGSGKSTLAKKLLQESQQNTLHVEADMYFIDRGGVYLFQPEKLSEAHHWCQQQSLMALKNKQNVIVANTFVKRWEMKFYEQLATRFNARLKVINCTGKFTNIHEVPKPVIAKMRKNWQV
ncbi:ATP-binding protein [Psychromonas sp. 14N.309.X.WAT.B.A12]|jgi:predicted kinase|uniref:ATP-binding protein n=1 Tax=Psychromonas sp. 14N.309.X.WAT.B.A12 TaxID=2998322 RepID=UPI0025B1C8D7|nr:ATP-binding protein [Psychromonas sp. 14N.309.X.WAT.B.A12]MDN2663553.1 ATP-binding protein [Psychromonas sp. 14N.309.X.WAT.B.A12]